MNTIILAGNYQEYLRFLKEMKYLYEQCGKEEDFTEEKYIYTDRLDSILGLRHVDFILYGNFYENGVWNNHRNYIQDDCAITAKNMTIFVAHAISFFNSIYSKNNQWKK